MKPSKQTLSVCLPVFNGQPFLEQALESVRQQTEKDFEFVVVDDCSTDGSFALAERYAAIDSRIVLQRNPRNLGLVGNWNRCLELASGEWIKFVFQDDFLAPNCLERMLAAVEPSEQIVACRRTLVGNTAAADATPDFYLQHALLLRRIFSRNRYLDPFEVCRLILDHPATNIIGEPSSVMFRRELISRFGTFNADLVMECDSEWWYRVSANTGIRLIDEELVSFRIHDRSASSAAHDHKKFHYRYLDRLIVLHEMAFHPAFRPLREVEAEHGGPKSIRHELARTLRSARRHIARLETERPDDAARCKAQLDVVLSRYPQMNLPWYAIVQEKSRKLFKGIAQSLA